MPFVFFICAAVLLSFVSPAVCSLDRSTAVVPSSEEMNGSADDFQYRAAYQQSHLPLFLALAPLPNSAILNVSAVTLLQKDWALQKTLIPVPGFIHLPTVFPRSFPE